MDITNQVLQLNFETFQVGFLKPKINLSVFDFLGGTKKVLYSKQLYNINLNNYNTCLNRKGMYLNIKLGIDFINTQKIKLIIIFSF